MTKPVATGLMALGALTFIVGAVAIFVPMVPSTPFFIACIVCLMHGSPRFVAWFSKKPIYSSYIDDFLRERSMTRRNKIKTLAVGTVAIGISFIILKPIWVRGLLVALTLAKYYYFIFCVWTKIEPGHGMQSPPQV